MSSVENAPMPATGTPSLAQQRIILAVLFVGIVVAVWWQDRGGSSQYPVQKFSQTPVSDGVEQLDFTTAEAAWSGLQIDSQGNLKIDALTETALSEVIALTEGQASELRLARMAFLLEKQFGATARQQVMELLPVLRSYKEAEQHWWKENVSRNPPAYKELFELQDELLGETLAKKMFSEQRRVAKMMLASQRIRSDASLTQTEKDQALMDLQKAFEEKGAPVE